MRATVAFGAAILTGQLGSFGAPPARAAPLTEAQIANYTGADRQQVLEKGAAAEGSLTVYSTGTQIQPLLDRFRQKYPYVKVSMAQAAAEDTARKVVEEQQAGFYAADVFELASYGLVPLRNLQLLQSFTSPELAQFPSEAIEPHHDWVSARESYIGIGYNTKVISSADAPKTYDDLLSPKWKDRMAISNSLSTTANWVGAMVLTKGSGFVEKLGAQNIRVYALIGRALANLTISGEAPIVPTTYDSHVFESREKGAPIAWVAPGPVPVTDSSVAIPVHAVHPYAAMLFVDFLLSEEGQKMYRDIGYTPSRKGLAPAGLGQLQKLYLTNRPNYLQDYQQWSDLTRRVFMHSGSN